MKKEMMVSMAFAFVMLFSAATVTAATEHLISLQGSVADDLGDPLATGDVAVRIYDAASAGNLAYDSGADFNGAVQDGIFDVVLGSVTPLDLDNTVKYYMEIDVNGEEVVGDATGGRQEFWPGSGDHINLQKRVTGTCAGLVMVGINEDGTAICEPDDGESGGIASCSDCDASFVNEGQTNAISSGMVQFNYAGSSSEGGPASDASDLNCAGCVGTSDIDSSQIQRRVSGVCAAGSSIRSIDAEGTVTCEADDEGTTDCLSCDSRFVNEGDLDHLDASDGSPSNAVFVDAVGNVGIGTTTPLSDLSVGGSGISGAAIYGEGDVYGGYFYNEDTDPMGLGYGVYGSAEGSGGGIHIGGYFNASGGEVGNYAVYATSTETGVYGYGNYSGATFNGGTYGVQGTGTNIGVQGAGTTVGVKGISSNYGVEGDGDYAGGFFRNDDTSGANDYGVYALADGAGGGTHYGGKFYARGGTVNIGVSATGSDTGVDGDGDSAGGWFAGTGTTGTSYGVYGYANWDGGDAHYGGSFDAKGATNNYGVSGSATETGGTNHYGGKFNAWGATNNYGVQAFGTDFGVDANAGGTAVRAGSLSSEPNYGVQAYGSTCDFIASGTGTNFCPISSIRWKRNIVEMDNALDKVLNLRGVYFDWDEEHGGQHDMGMIAEEVGEVVPEVVAYEDDGEYAIGLDYGALTPLLIQAIKEQNEAIKELKEDNDTLKELVCLDHPDAEVCDQ